MKNNTITGPRGFLAAGIYCGIKKSKKHDLGLIVCPLGAKAAAVFTTNTIVSAAVTVCKQHVKSSEIGAVVVNSGNANACTGNKGINDAIDMCSEMAEYLEIDPHQVLVASTGVIGEHLPINTVKAGIKTAAEKLSSSSRAGLDFAKAIMTTDTKLKQAYTEVAISGKKVCIAGTIKGAGMIGPNMATTLSFITTDAAISKAFLNKALKDAVSDSINKVTVDIHQSTNDTAMILASGLAGNRVIKTNSAEYKKFAKALHDLCSDLAGQMVMDAEGATKMFKVEVNSAASKLDAAKAARAVADYPLVKCAVHGSDPNWGRIICAIGSCGVKLNQEKLSCWIGGVIVFRNGRPVKFEAKKVSKIISQKEHCIRIDLGAGNASDFCYGCDLSKGYVTINADYHT
jgi:glutamate N-acetyltransferase/amino-acid N-acetyltransferase